MRGLIVVLMMMASSALAQTPWPAYISTLELAHAETTELAELPADVVIAQPGPMRRESIAAKHQTKFSGIWHGWACPQWFCDIAIAIEAIEPNAVRLVYARAYSGHPSRADRLTGEFIDQELRARIPNGTSLVLRLRNDDPDVMEMAVLGPDGKLRAAGVLSQKPLEYERSSSRLPTPWRANGKALTLELIEYRPASPGPYPTVIFHHGSTGSGADPKRFGWTWSNPTLAQFLTRRGWQVLFPQRRGRGKSDGEYAEGLKADGSGYACEPSLSIAGAEHALEDLRLISDEVRKRADVEHSRLLLAGLSRGGVLAVVHAAERPEQFIGALNFAGGWMGDQCQHVAAINPVLFERGAGGKPSLWIYGPRDPFYSLAHSRRNFEAFSAAGGEGRFVELEPPQNANGHLIVFFPQVWVSQFDEFISSVARR